MYLIFVNGNYGRDVGGVSDGDVNACDGDGGGYDGDNGVMVWVLCVAILVVAAMFVIVVVNVQSNKVTQLARNLRE